MSDAGEEIIQTLARSIAARSGRPVGDVLEEMRAAQARGVADFTTRGPALPTRDELKGRGVPEKHLRAVFDQGPKGCEAMIHVRRFVANRDEALLVLMGNVGTCKSGSAAWALTQKSGRFISLQDLARAAIAGPKDEEGRAAWRACKAVGLLVIDDVGTEFVSDWAVSALNEIVNVRYEACAQTLITVNTVAAKAEEAVAAFKGRYGARIVDRANEFGGVTVLAGKSVRGRKW